MCVLLQPTAVRGCRSNFERWLQSPELPGGGVLEVNTDFPFFTNAGPPPMAAFTPFKSGMVAVDISNFMPGASSDRPARSCGPTDNTMTSGEKRVLPLV